MRAIAFVLAFTFSAAVSAAAFAGCGGSGGYLVDQNGKPVVETADEPNTPAPKPKTN